MKVMHLVPAMEQGGVETVVLSLNRVVVGSGWENIVVSRGGRLAARIEADGGRHVTMDLKSKNPLTYFLRAAKLRKLLEAEKPDLVCAHSRVPAWLFVWANRKLGIRWITYAHGANSVSRYSEVMTKGDLTVTPSRFLADYLKSNYGLNEAKIRVISPGVDSTRFDPENTDKMLVEKKRREWGIEDGDYVVMAVGRITPVKGLDMLIRAVSRLKDKKTKLVLIGDADKGHGEHLSMLKRLAQESGLSTRIVFAGGESRIPECLSLASVVVSANTRKPESFGLSMAEALMMGKPVVAKGFGGALDIVRDGIDGVQVSEEAGDPADAFARAIGRVRGQAFADLREGACARFGLDKMIEKTKGLYRECLG